MALNSCFRHGFSKLAEFNGQGTVQHWLYSESPKSRYLLIRWQLLPPLVDRPELQVEASGRWPSPEAGRRPAVDRSGRPRRATCVKAIPARLTWERTWTPSTCARHRSVCSSVTTAIVRFQPPVRDQLQRRRKTQRQRPKRAGNLPLKPYKGLDSQHSCPQATQLRSPEDRPLPVGVSSSPKPGQESGFSPFLKALHVSTTMNLPTPIPRSRHP